MTIEPEWHLSDVYYIQQDPLFCCREQVLKLFFPLLKSADSSEKSYKDEVCSYNHFVAAVHEIRGGVPEKIKLHPYVHHSQPYKP